MFINVVKPDSGPDDDVIIIARELIKVSLDNCWGKFDEYYKILDLSLAYAAVVILYFIYK